MTNIDTLSTGMIFAGWPILTVFIVFYGLRSPWRGTPVSRAVMELTVALWLLYAISAANSLYGLDWPYRGAVRAVIYTAVTASIVHLTVVLLRLQHHDRVTMLRRQQDSTEAPQPASEKTGSNA